jgi:hypothetical protein
MMRFRLTHDLGIIAVGLMITLALSLGWFTTGSPGADRLILIAMSIICWAHCLRQLVRAFREHRARRREMKETARTSPRIGMLHRANGDLVPLLFISEPDHEGRYRVVDTMTGGYPVLEPGDTATMFLDNGRMKEIDLP